MIMETVVDLSHPYLTLSFILILHLPSKRSISNSNTSKRKKPENVCTGLNDWWIYGTVQ